MSGTFPSSPKFNALSVTSIQPTMVSRTISGRRQARQIAGQYFGMRASFPPMTREQFAPINAFVMKQRGQYETFQLILPVLSTGLGQPVGAPLVKGASQTGRSIITDGWSNNSIGNITSLVDTTPSVTWGANNEGGRDMRAQSTSGSGELGMTTLGLPLGMQQVIYLPFGFRFNSVTDGSGNPTISIANGGSGFEVGDTLVLRDPDIVDPQVASATVTVGAVDDAGVYEVTDYTPTLSGQWSDTYNLDNGTHYNVSQTSTSGSGTGVKFTIEPTYWDNSTTKVSEVKVTITNAGKGYAVDDTILITDPGSTSETITLTVKTITAPVNSRNKLQAGDYLKFANHDKVYTVTDDVETNSSGEATIDIEPALITSPADNSVITHTDVPFLVSLASGVQEYATNTSGLFAYELDFTEVL